MRPLLRGQAPALLVLALCLAACGADGAESSSSEPEVVDDVASQVQSQVQEELAGGLDVLLTRAREPFFGDLPELKRARFIRVLVSHSKMSFFYDGGTPRGFEVDMLKGWESSLNEGANSKTSVRLVFVPTPFDRLVDDLLDGRGDIIAAGLTVTPERSARAAFTRPYIGSVDEVVVEHRGLGSVTSLEDLAGRRVVVRAGSSYVGHLEELSRRLEEGGAQPIEVVRADRRLLTEDLLEMANAGAIALTVADDHIAKAWAGVFPDLQVHDELQIHSGGEIAWGVRPDSKELLASLNAFVAKNKQGSLLGNMLLKRYYSKSKWIANPLMEKERAKLAPQIKLYQQYGGEFDFDWLALAAQAYQESGLDQSKKSPAGALGVMQLLPSTAADKSVGIREIHLIANNINAGAKYLDFLRNRYFNDPEMDPAARVDFAWAAYNAGPARIRRLRSRAEERGFDPNRWFANVEQLAAEDIGRETVDYVANINKYYLAYRLHYQAALERAAVKSQVGDQ